MANHIIPGQSLVYERTNGVVYARYRDPPHNEIARWIVGGDPDAVSRATGDMFSWGEWQDMHRTADSNPALKKQLDRLLVMYYTVKDSNKD